MVSCVWCSLFCRCWLRRYPYSAVAGYTSIAAGYTDRAYITLLSIGTTDGIAFKTGYADRMSSNREDGWIQTYIGRRYIDIVDIAHAFGQKARFNGYCSE